jgi:hypothetical protein
MRQPRRHIRPNESPIDVIGRRFGEMVVIAFSPETSKRAGRTYWRIRCDCGKEFDKQWASIRDGIRCGRCKPITHGDARRGAATTEFVTWRCMIGRCTTPTNDDFHHYGGRGIKVCERWINSYPNFLADMGRKPTPKHSIERKDANGDYEPLNCIWALQVDQVRNRRNTLRVEFKGRTMSLADAAEQAGFTRNLVYVRISKLGWSAEQALTTRRLEYGERRPK